MKKIALISDGWKRMVTYAWVEGITKRIEEIGEKVCVYQYNCFGNWIKDRKYNQGEYNIFRLPDLSRFDGVVLDCNFISEKQWRQEIQDIVGQVSVPVISIGFAVDGCYYVGIDNTTPMKKMMEHLHLVHGCTRFLFAGGPKGNYENFARMKAFRDYIEAAGLNDIEHAIWFGDYDYDTGVEYMKRLKKEGEPYPDAIVCANDNIAAGICATAEELGLHVPEDFIVTGFDNMEKAAYFNPQITTIGNDRELIAAAAIDMFHEIWSGKKVDTFQFVPTECYFTESCGCENNGSVDYRNFMKNQIIAQNREQKEDERRIEMESRMAECTDFYGILHEMAEYVTKMDCDGFYAVIDKRLYDGVDDKEFATVGYSMENMVVAYAAEKGKELSFDSVENLNAYLDKARTGCAYMFTPLHFRQHAVGYTVVKNARFLGTNPYFYDIQSACMRGMESLFKHIQLEKINCQLKEVSKHDPLTGLYNRIAYTEMIAPAYKKYQEEGVACCLAFFDANNFKEINDTMGHEYGDMLLKRIARILLELLPKEGYAYRFGGDEFVVFFPYASKQTAEEYRNNFLEVAESYGISVSIGVIVTEPERDAELDDYLTEADVQMYKMKKAEKKKLGK